MMKSLGRTAFGVAAALAMLAPVACDSPTGTKQPVAARLDIVSGDLQTATVNTELAQPLVVRVLDDQGHRVKGQIINFRVTAGNGSVFAGSAITDNDGEARERWTLGTVAGDTQKVEARAVDPKTGAPLVFATFRAVATAGAPNSIAAAGATSFTGLPLLPLADSVAAVVRDVYGNLVPGASVVWTVIKGGGSASPGTSTTGSAGVARTSWTLGGQVDSLQVIEAAAGLTLKTQFTANGRVPGDAVVVKVSGDAQTDTVARALPQPLVVRVQRANGTPVAGIPVTFSGNGSFSPATAVSGANGQVSVQWTLPAAAGSAAATATIATGSTVGFGAMAVHGAAAQVTATLLDHVGPVTLPWVRTVQGKVADPYGNGISGITLSFTPAAGNGSASPTSAASGADGTAQTQWTLASTTGAQTLTVSAGALSAVATDAVPPAAFPGAITKVSGDDQVADRGEFLPAPLVVRVLHAGQPVAGETVGWRYPIFNGADSLSTETSTVTDAQGYASLSYRNPGRGGVYRVTAFVPGASVEFTTTSGFVGAATNLVHRGPGGQLAAAGDELADSITVRATGNYNLPKPGVEITWSVVSGGGSVSSPTSVTGASGEARVAWRLGAGPGVQQLVAQAPGLPSVSYYASTSPGPVVRTDSLLVLMSLEGYYVWIRGTVVSSSSPVQQMWFDVGTSPDDLNAIPEGGYSSPQAMIGKYQHGVTYYGRFGARSADGVSMGEIKQYTCGAPGSTPWC